MADYTHKNSIKPQHYVGQLQLHFKVKAHQLPFVLYLPQMLFVICCQINQRLLSALSQTSFSIPHIFTHIWILRYVVIFAEIKKKNTNSSAVSLKVTAFWGFCVQRTSWQFFCRLGWDVTLKGPII